jgi:hypothetical protein
MSDVPHDPAGPQPDGNPDPIQPLPGGPPEPVTPVIPEPEPASQR